MQEYRVHMAVWAVVGSPLIQSADPRTLSQDCIDMMTNPEILAVNQDPLVGTPFLAWQHANSSEVQSNTIVAQAIGRPLHDGSVAVVLVNRGEATANLTVTWEDINLPAGQATVRDLWARRNVGTFSSSFSAAVPRHSDITLRITPRHG